MRIEGIIFKPWGEPFLKFDQKQKHKYKGKNS